MIITFKHKMKLIWYILISKTNEEFSNFLEYWKNEILLYNLEKTESGKE